MAARFAEGLADNETSMPYIRTTSTKANSDTSSEWSIRFTPAASDAGDDEQSQSMESAMKIVNHHEGKDMVYAKGKMGVVLLKNGYWCVIYGIQWVGKGFWRQISRLWTMDQEFFELYLEETLAIVH